MNRRRLLSLFMIFCILAIQFLPQNVHANENITRAEIDNPQIRMEVGNSATELYSYERGYITVKIDFSNLEEAKEGLYVEVVAPTSKWNDHILNPLWNNASYEQRYLDVFLMRNLNLGTLEKSFTTNFSKIPGKAIMRVDLNRVDKTDFADFEVTYSFTRNIMPESYEFAPEVILYDANGIVLARKFAPASKIKYSKEINLETKILPNDYSTKENIIDGGESNSSNPNYLSENNAEKIGFQYKISTHSGSSYYPVFNAGQVKVKLPTYETVDGQTKTAVFDATSSRDWQNDGNGTLTYRKDFNIPNDQNLQYYIKNKKYIDEKRDTKDGSNSAKDYFSYVETTPLYLSFPGIKIKENNQLVDQHLNVTGEFIPLDYITNTSSSQTVDQKFNLIGDETDKILTFTGTTVDVDPNYIHDTNSAYTYRLENKTEYMLKNIKFSQLAENVDERLYIKDVEVTLLDERGRPHYQIPIHFDLYFKSGQINLNSNIHHEVKLSGNPNYSLNIYKLGLKLTDGQITKEEAKNQLDPNELTLKKVDFWLGRQREESGQGLPPGYTLQYKVHVELKEPFEEGGLPVGSPRYLNRIDTSFDYYTADGRNKVRNENLTKNAEVIINSSEEKKPVITNVINNTIKNFAKGQDVRYDIGLRFANFPQNVRLNQVNLIELLPISLNVKQGAEPFKMRVLEPKFDSGFRTLTDEENFIKDYEIINNFKGTGRTAIKFNFKDIAINNHRIQQIPKDKTVYIQLWGFDLNDNAIPKKFEKETDRNNWNEVFIGFPKHIYLDKVSNIIADEFDLNNNSNTEELTVAKAESRFDFTEHIVMHTDFFISSNEDRTETNELNSNSHLKKLVKTQLSQDSVEDKGKFKYNVIFRNYRKKRGKETVVPPVHGIEALLILPQQGDNQGSQFGSILDGSPNIYLDSQLVNDQYQIYYYTGDTTGSVEELSSRAGWLNSVSEFSQVKAIKVVAKDNTALETHKLLNIQFNMKSPDIANQQFVGQKEKAIGYIRYGRSPKYLETNAVEHIISASDTRNIQVTKEWQNVPATSSVRVYLYADNQKVDEIILDENNSWRHIFENKPIYGSDGQTEIVYRIEEQDVTGYTVSYEGDVNSGFVIKTESIQLDDATRFDPIVNSITRKDTDLPLTEKDIQDAITAPDGASITIKKLRSDIPTGVGNHSVLVEVTWNDNSKETVNVTVNITESDKNKYNPTVIEGNVVVTVGQNPNENDIKAKVVLDGGKGEITNVALPSNGNVGVYNAVVTITYEDGTSETVNVPVEYRRVQTYSEIYNPTAEPIVRDDQHLPTEEEIKNAIRLEDSSVIRSKRILNVRDIPRRKTQLPVEIQVEVTYTDNSKETVNVLVSITESDKNKYNPTVKRENVVVTVGQNPNENDIKAKVVLDGGKGEITNVVLPSNNKAGVYNAVVTITYEDGTSETVNVPVEYRIPEEPSKPNANKKPVGWKYINGKWYYYDKQSNMQTGWIKDEGIWYYLAKDGAMQTGWQKVSGYWYYLSESGAMQTGWQKVSGYWYYMVTSGEMQTGWQKISGYWYYMVESGEMQTGWQKISGEWYYLAESGEMQTGWQKISGEWYYMVESGEMQTGWQKISGEWYYMVESGEMQTGWQKISGIWYYMKESGAMAFNQWVGDYYLSSSGAMLTNTITPDGYRVDQYGKLIN